MEINHQINASLIQFNPWDKHSQTGKGSATGSDDIEAITDEIFNEKVSELK